jgi:hypothetical protein
MKNYQDNSSNTQIKESGCYFYCLIVAAGHKPEEAEALYEEMISYGYMLEDCYIVNPCRILRRLTNKMYIIAKSKTCDPNAYIKIARWYNPETKYEHYVLMADNETVLFDSFGESDTVKNGYIADWRLFYLD